MEKNEQEKNLHTHSYEDIRKLQIQTWGIGIFAIFLAVVLLVL